MDVLDLSGWSLPAVAALFVAASVMIVLAGTRLTATADRLADASGLGEAVFGAILLGASTSLAGIVASLVTAYQDYPELAISNAIGNVAAQTTVLAIADLFYRRANLEHAAASIANLAQGALVVVLLSIPLLAYGGPAITFWGVHPLSLALVIAYIFGQRLVRQSEAQALWRPRKTSETRPDVPQHDYDEGSSRSLWAWFAVLAVIMSVAGYGVAESAMALTDRTGLSQTVIGGLLVAVVTASPELVTSVAAVRQGALTLAVGGIIGGNTFDVMVVSLADVAYRDGSIYHAITDQQVFFIALTLVLNGLLLLGMIRRERSGVAGIGFESAMMLVLYVAAFVLISLTG